MPRSRLSRVLALTAWLAVSAATALVASAEAQTSKLDPRARIALARLRAGHAVTVVAEAGLPVTADGRGLDVFVRGDVSRAQLEQLGVVIGTELPGLFTARIPLGAVNAVAELPGVTEIRGAVTCEPELDASALATGATAQHGAGPSFTGTAGQGVLVGVVDSGVDYNHGDFVDNGGSNRIVALWDQTGAGSPPAGFAYGREWSTASLNNSTCTETDPQGHGTHVLGIAAGDGSQTGGAIPAYTYAGMAPRADIAFVKTTFTTTAILDGVNYVFQKATARAENAVVNLSLGSHYGPHDGTSAFESGIDALATNGRIIVKSAGNERGQARHAEVFASGGGTNATMSVANSATGAQFAIDGYYEATENVRVRITAPGGTIIGPVSMGSNNAAYPGASTPNGTVYLENGVAITSTGDREIYIEVNVAGGQSANGTWTFTLIPVSLGAANGEVDLWRFASTGSLTADFVTGNQADQEMISEPGNAANVVTVASYNTKSNWVGCNGTAVGYSPPLTLGEISSFSSPGPTRDGRQKPDIAAPGQGIGAARSFDMVQPCPGAGTPSTLLNDGANHFVQQGTSMAAPHVTGAVALILQKLGARTPAQIKAHLSSNAVVDGQTGTVWNKDYGNGKMRTGDLLDPTATLLGPNGSETVYAGTATNVTWTASDAVGVTSVDLELSRNGAGGTFNTIATGIANTGTYSWTPTIPATTNAFVRVRARDAANNTVTDVSNAAFTLIDPTAALVALFSAEPDDGGIRVRWQLTDPGAYTSVTAERAPAGIGPWSSARGTITEEGSVTVLTDTQVDAGDTYYYRLSATRVSGGVDHIGPIVVTAGQPLVDFELAGVAPNPTTGATRITFVVPRTAPVQVTIVDVLGRQVAELVRGTLTPGRYDAIWSGEGDHGRAEAGLYFVRYQSPAGVQVSRVALAR